MGKLVKSILTELVFPNKDLMTWGEHNNNYRKILLNLSVKSVEQNSICNE